MRSFSVSPPTIRPLQDYRPGTLFARNQRQTSMPMPSAPPVSGLVPANPMTARNREAVGTEISLEALTRSSTDRFQNMVGHNQYNISSVSMEQGNMYATEATPIVDMPPPPVNINIIPDTTDMAFNTSLNNSSLNTSMNNTSLNVSNGSMNTPPVVPVTPEEGEPPRQRDSAGTAGEVLKGVEFNYEIE